MGWARCLPLPKGIAEQSNPKNTTFMRISHIKITERSTSPNLDWKLGNQLLQSAYPNSWMWHITDYTEVAYKKLTSSWIHNIIFRHKRGLWSLRICHAVVCRFSILRRPSSSILWSICSHRNWSHYQKHEIISCLSLNNIGIAVSLNSNLCAGCNVIISSPQK